MTRRELLSSTDSKELTEWMAYAELEPFGEERADLRAGIIASVLANIAQSLGKKSKKKYKPQDFMPEFDKKEKPSAEELKDKFKKVFGIK